jgi:mRNA interferase MazF
VQADDLLALSTAVVCPTSTTVPAASFHPEIELGGERTRVLCEMIGAVVVRNLGPHVAHLSYEELRQVEEAVVLVLGLR